MVNDDERFPTDPDEVKAYLLRLTDMPDYVLATKLRQMVQSWGYGVFELVAGEWVSAASSVGSADSGRPFWIPRRRHMELLRALGWKEGPIPEELANEVRQRVRDEITAEYVQMVEAAAR